MVWFERRGGIGLGAVKSGGPKRVTVVDDRGDAHRIPRARLLGTLSARVEAGGHHALRAGLKRLRSDMGGLEPPDLDLLWSCLEDDRGYRLEELLELCFGEAGDPQAIALVAALSPSAHGRIATPFRITKGKVERVDAETLARLRAKEERAAQEAAEQESFLAWYREARDRPAPLPEPPHEHAQTWLEVLQAYALRADHAPRAAGARRLAKQMGLDSPDALLRELEGCGALPRDVNELPGRRGLRVSFPSTVRRAADELLAAPRTGEDLRHVATIAIDDAGTVEVDDALSWWEEDGETFLAVHIARVADAIAPGSPLDAEAHARATSVYFPGETIPMLPLPLVQQRLSLEAGSPREALSLVCRIDERGRPQEARFARTQIQVDWQVDYDAAASQPGPRELLERLLPIAEELRARRRAAGAVVVSLPNLKLILDPERGPIPTLLSSSRPAQRVVSELMVLYNAELAERLRRAGTPALFRTQPQQVSLPRDLDPSDPLYPVRVRRSLPPTTVQCRPGPQRTMGLPAYVQATSPMRRCADLIAQRQLLALLDGTPALSIDALEEARAGLNRLERRARQLEDERNRYLICRWLGGAGDQEAIVSRAGPRAAVYLPAVDRELPAALPEDAEVGQPVRVRVRRVDARAREVLLELAEEL